MILFLKNVSSTRNFDLNFYPHYRNDLNQKTNLPVTVEKGRWEVEQNLLLSVTLFVFQKHN